MSIRHLHGRFLVCLALTGWPLAGASQTEPPVIAQGQGQGEAPTPALPDAGPVAPAGPVLPGTGGSVQKPAAMGVLVLDVDQAYVSSAWGKRAQADIEAAAREIEAENARMEDQLVGEEQALAAERDSLNPADFRQKAEAFDTRAQTIRRDRRQAAVDLGNRAQADRNAFVDASLPVIAGIMQERAAGLVLDRRQVLAAANAVDVTQDLVERMDQQVGDGGQLPDVPPADVTEDRAGTVPLDARPPSAQP